MAIIYFTVTNDLTYDQRMHRICGSLARAGYEVCLVGRQLKNSVPYIPENFRHTRIKCFFNNGFLFYAEYNIRLFFFLLLHRFDVICAIDLDTILPCLLVSKIKRTHRVYDAHEYFTEMKEIRTRTLIKKVWNLIEMLAVPRFKYGYTVSDGLANEFRNRHKIIFEVIRNFPVLKQLNTVEKSNKYLLYQGAVNEGRAFEYLIPALKISGKQIVICGDGNYMNQLKKLIKDNGVEEQVQITGMLLPKDLWLTAQQATLGISLSEKEGVNQFHALPNKFLEYIHAGLPQLTMAYPEYLKINEQYKVAVLIDHLAPHLIAEKINFMMANAELLEELHHNCLEARKILCWENEEKKLVEYYSKIVQP